MKEIFEKVHRIIQLALEISTETEADVFVEYSPHTASVGIEVYNHGWSDPAKSDIEYTCYFDYPNGWELQGVFRDPSLDEVIAELEELKATAGKKEAAT